MLTGDKFVEMARSHFSYDAESGLLTRLDPGPEAFDTLKGYRIARRFFGRQVTAKNGKGYITVTVRRCTYLGHRIAWAIVHGFDPEGDIDHEDRDRANNRLKNLRMATRSQNRMNSNMRSDNRSGARGVHWHNVSGKWAASICVNAKRVHLGVFSSKGDAISAYAMAQKELHGDFAAETN